MWENGKNDKASMVLWTHQERENMANTTIQGPQSVNVRKITHLKEDTKEGIQEYDFIQKSSKDEFLVN